MVLWYYGRYCGRGEGSAGVLWYYGTVVLWYYGTMVLWYYGTMDEVTHFSCGLSYCGLAPQRPNDTESPPAL